MPGTRYRYQVMCDPGPYPLASGLLLSNHDLTYGLSYGGFTEGTQIKDKDNGIVFTVVDMNNPNGSLKQILRELHDQAEKQPGRVHEKYLQRGLKIEIMFRAEVVHFRISRGSRSPSLTEWNTCLDALPYEAPKVDPNKNVVQGRYYLSQKWPLLQRKLI